MRSGGAWGLQIESGLWVKKGGSGVREENEVSVEVDDVVKAFLHKAGPQPESGMTALGPDFLEELNKQPTNGLGTIGRDWWIEIIDGSYTFDSLSANIEIVRRGGGRISLSVIWSNAIGYQVKYKDEIIARGQRRVSWLLGGFELLYSRVQDWRNGYEKGHSAGVSEGRVKRAQEKEVDNGSS